MSDPSEAWDAVVVGSGPNGLAAALTLARAGRSVLVLEGADTVGGGARSAELFETGVLHDVCSAVHPFGAASPFFRASGLEAYGLEWRYAEVEVAHPVDGGRAGALFRSIEESASSMGVDGGTWQRTFGPLVRSAAALSDSVLGPILRMPRHPVALGRFGLHALRSAARVARRWETDEVRGMYAGIAAHAMQPLDRATTAGVGAMFVTAAHSTGWPVARGGSQAITGSLVAALTELGGRVETGRWVGSLRELPPSHAVLLDVAPVDALRIAGDAVATRSARALRRWKHGPGACKVDFLLDGPIPWSNETCRRAATVHCGGSFDEVAAAEIAVSQGRMPDRPFVLVGQQHLADPERCRGSRIPVWAYAHVPAGWDRDATDAIVDQIERFAPGFRDRIVATATRTATDLARYNPNYVGGDIATGANSPLQAVFRPGIALDPYRIGENVYLCSAATPPGAGVHGMCGYHAARSVLRRTS